jgi:hypothetical protein
MTTNMKRTIIATFKGESKRLSHIIEEHSHPPSQVRNFTKRLIIYQLPKVVKVNKSMQQPQYPKKKYIEGKQVKESDNADKGKIEEIYI